MLTCTAGIHVLERMKFAASALVAAGVAIHLAVSRYAMQRRRYRQRAGGADFNAIFSSFPHLKRLYGLAGLSGDVTHTLAFASLQCLAVLIHTFRRGISLRDCLFAAPALVSQLWFVFYNSNLKRSPLGSALTALASDSTTEESCSRRAHSKSLQRRSRFLEAGLYALTAWELHQRVMLPLAEYWHRHRHATGSLFLEGVAAVCKSARIIQSMAGSGIIASYIVFVTAHLWNQIVSEKEEMQVAWNEFYDAAQEPGALHGKQHAALVRRLKRLGEHRQEQENGEGLFLMDISQQWQTLDYLFMSVGALSVSLVLPSFTAFGEHIRRAVSQKHWNKVIKPMVLGDTYIAEALRLLSIAMLAFHQGLSLQRLARTFSKQLQYHEWQLLLALSMTDMDGLRGAALLHLLKAAHTNLITWDLRLKVVQGGQLLSTIVKHATRVGFSAIVIFQAASTIRGSFPSGFIDTPLSTLLPTGYPPAS